MLQLQTTEKGTTHGWTMTYTQSIGQLSDETTQNYTH